MLSTILLTALMAHSAAADPTPPDRLFPPSESLVYTLKFIDTTAGECVMETLPPTQWEGQSVHHFRATVRTVGLIGTIYPYSETVDVYTDRAQLTPLYVDVSIHDRKKMQHTQIRLDRKTGRGEEIEDSTEPGEQPHHRIKGWAMTAGAQSLFSILHYMRAQPLAAGGQVKFPVSHDEKNAEFIGDVLRTEMVPTAKGEREAYVVKVAQSFANVFYGNVKDEPLLWFSTDGRKLPLRFEFKHRLGRVFAVLRNPPPAAASETAHASR